MTKRTRIAKFYSDSNFAHFKDAAEWRHTANNMTINDAKLTIEFKGDIDPVLADMVRTYGGTWNDA